VATNALWSAGPAVGRRHARRPAPGPRQVTVYLAVAYWPPTSVAVTTVPEVPVGTLKVQLNVPVALVAREPLVQLEITTLSNTSDRRVVSTENPVPDTVTVEPAAPRWGLTVILGVVTLNFAVAVWPPTSVATTEVPEVPLGTVVVQLNAPTAVVVRPPPTEQLEIVTPSNTSDASVFDTENPVPEIVTVAPIGPCFGLTVIFGVVAVKVPLAVVPPMSVATTDVPEVPLGTANVQLNAPVAPVVSDPLVQEEMGTLSKTSDASALDTEKPVPDTFTVAPIGPRFGVTTMLGVVTLNVPDAV
jgi:hypothetical protein